MMLRVLAALLVVQIAVVGWLYWPADTAPGDPARLVDGITREAVEQITIRGPEGASVSLRRSDAGWVSTSGLPVDADKLKRILQALLDSDPGFAIAQSDAAARRFTLEADNFEREITLTGAGREAVVYLGSSPAFRKIHARAAANNAIYVIELNSFDAPATLGEWLDGSLLALRDVSAVTTGTGEYRLLDDRWTGPEGDLEDSEAMESLLTVLAGLRVTGIAAADDEDLAGAEPVLTLRVQAGANERELTLLKGDDEDLERYFLRRDDYADSFSTSSYDAERLLDAIEALTAEPEAP